MAGKDRSNISRGENTVSYVDNGQTKYRQDVDIIIHYICQKEFLI